MSLEFLTHLYGVQWDVSPVEAVPVIVKVQSHRLPEASQRQGLVCAGGQVVAMDGVPHGVQDELVTLWNTTGDMTDKKLACMPITWYTVLTLIWVCIYLCNKPWLKKKLFLELLMYFNGITDSEREIFQIILALIFRWITHLLNQTLIQSSSSQTSHGRGLIR